MITKKQNKIEKYLKEAKYSEILDNLYKNFNGFALPLRYECSHISPCGKYFYLYDYEVNIKDKESVKSSLERVKEELEQVYARDDSIDRSITISQRYLDYLMLYSFYFDLDDSNDCYYPEEFTNKLFSTI